jgi:hypothetical protein
MKIKLLLPQYEGRGSYFKSWRIEVQNFDEANRLMPASIDREIYSFIKTLEHKKNFVDEIKSIRNDLGILENGYSYDEWISLKDQIDIKISNYTDYIKTISRLIKRFNIPFLLRSNLRFIIIGGFVLLPLAKISFNHGNMFLPIYEGPSLEIIIRGKINNPHEITKFIDDNWKTIQEKTQAFDNEVWFEFSDRWLEVVNLKQLPMTHSQIAEYLSDKDNDIITPENAKKIYSRAKQRMKKIPEG